MPVGELIISGYYQVFTSGSRLKPRRLPKEAISLCSIVLGITELWILVTVPGFGYFQFQLLPISVCRGSAFLRIHTEDPVHDVFEAIGRHIAEPILHHIERQHDCAVYLFVEETAGYEMAGINYK